MSQNTPGDACNLIGKRDRQYVAVQPLLDRLDSGLKSMAFPTLRLDQHNPCGLHEQDTQVAIAMPRYLAEDGAVPGRRSAWARDPAKRQSRVPSRTPRRCLAATMALEVIGPMPGTLISRLQPGSCCATATISPDK